MRAALLTMRASCLRLRASSARNPTTFADLRATSPTVLRLLGLRAGPHAIGAITVWIVRRPSRRAHSQALAAGAIGSALCAPASNPWILGTIVSAAAHSPTRCRIASATARNRRHVARIASSAARNPRLCSDCERAGSSRRRHQSPWERSCS